MPTKKTTGRKPPSKKQPLQISIDRSLVKAIDANPETKRLGSRSAFIVQAILGHLRRQEASELEAQVRRAYAGHEEEALAEVVPYLPHQIWSDTPAEPLAAQPRRRAAGGKR